MEKSNKNTPSFDDLDPNLYFTRQEIYDGEEITQIFRKARKPTDSDLEADLANAGDPMLSMGHGFCPPFNQRVYNAGEGVICEQDVPVKMRDGAILYCDIFKPENFSGKIPAILSWSFFGKRPGDGMSEWQIMGVPPGTVSRLAKFESPDPMYWCRHGYAVINIDTRGVGHSEGDIYMFTHRDAEDGYDFVEWIAQQVWCNGKVGMGGNSGVAMSQTRVAATQPPHLACIAPWEGTTDIYRESIYEGGIPALAFNAFIATSLTGPGGVDDQVEMAKHYPLMNGYWRDKIPNFSKIRVPAYFTCGWSHFHLRGSVQAFRKTKSRKKWIRMHRDFEWPDGYNPEHLEDLKRFYDRYLKDIYNGWELTPRVRVDVMDAYDCDFQTYRPETSFPIERTQYVKYYLDAANMTMRDAPIAVESKVAYDPETQEAVFDMEFKEDTELTGYISLHLWVSSPDHDDMDMFVNIQKADKDGKWIPWTTLNEPHPGAWGKLRVSHRTPLDETATKFQPVLAHTEINKLKPGEIAPVDIEIVPSSRIWHKGEKLRIQVSGRYIREGWFEPFSWETDNVGKHVIHTGGQYDSWIQVPVIPPKWRSGDYTYR